MALLLGAEMVRGDCQPRHTDAGRQILLDAIDVMTAIEHDYAAVLGDGDLDSLKGLLARLSDHVDPHGGLATD